MNDEKKEEPLKERLDRYKHALKQGAVGLGIIVLGGVIGPILGIHLGNDPDIYKTMAMITIPISGIAAAVYVYKIKGYFDLKKKTEEEKTTRL